MSELFKNAKSMKEINEMTIQFLKGELNETCYHYGPIDEETYEIRDKLIRINELVDGVTTSSQPGIEPEGESRWEQRCYVSLVLQKKLLTKFVKILYGKMPDCTIHIIENTLRMLEEHEIVSRYTDNNKFVNNTNAWADSELFDFETVGIYKDIKKLYTGICINDTVWGRKDYLLDKIIETLEELH